ncbi:major facilitator superfamily domain-containing protein [Phascolomyces articulosus]|uniref:Major facilitator superfamily domain-containing protein n=1 Tax=Phascolomyces articulosus TaxID=60185 RepID=A0AAD5KCL6_9FUNG|nr:major facilitator superfamily domain-containing protein [Phascolomyces articulosus]
MYQPTNNDNNASSIAEEKIGHHGTPSLSNYLQDVTGTSKKEHTARGEESFSEEKTRAEKKLVCKLDIRIMILLCLWRIGTRYDGTNVLPNAKIVGIVSDLHMTDAQYRWCLTAPFIAFLILSIPLNLLLRKWRPALMVGALSLVWGSVTMVTPAVTNFPGLLISQIIIGIFSTANNAVLVYYIALWYRRCESAQRFGWTQIAANIGSCVSGLVALGATEIPATSTMNAWKWMFVIFAIPSVATGILCLLFLPDEPETSKVLNNQERELAVERLASEQAYTDIHSWSWSQVLSVLTDWKLYWFLLFYLTANITLGGARLNLPSIIKSMGDWNEQITLALTAPTFIVSCIFTYVLSWLSDKYQQRAYFIVLTDLISALGALMVMFIPEQQVGARYFAVCIYKAAVDAAEPIRNAWIAECFSGLSRRAVAAGFLFMGDAAGNAIAGQSFFDPPRYLMGYTIGLASLAVNIISILVFRWILYRVNKNRDEIVQNEEKSKQQIIKYGGDKFVGDRHPRYRYSL